MTAPSSTGGPRPGPRRRPDFGSGGGGGGGRKFTPRRKVCQFCVDKIKVVDYKDLGRLRRFLSERGKIEPRRKTGTCAAHQRSLNVALKRARQLAMLPFTAEHIRITGVLVREPGAPPFRGTRGPRPIEQDGAVAPEVAPEVTTEVDSAEAVPAGEPSPAVVDGEAPAAAATGESPAPEAEAPAKREVPSSGQTTPGA